MSAYKHYTDSELVTLLKTGDLSAFNEIYNRFSGLLYIYARKIIKDKEEAEDLVQDIFISFWNASKGLELKTSLSSYLYSAVRYKFFDLVSHRKIRSDYASNFQKFIDLNAYSTDYYVNERELAVLVEKEVANLPGKMRMVFELSRNAGFSHKKIAEDLNLSEKTVRNHVNHALKILRFKLGLIALLMLFSSY